MVRRKYCYSEAFQRNTDFWIPSLSLLSLQPFWGGERFEKSSEHDPNIRGASITFSSVLIKNIFHAEHLYNRVEVKHNKHAGTLLDRGMGYSC